MIFYAIFADGKVIDVNTVFPWRYDDFHPGTGRIHLPEGRQCNLPSVMAE